MDIEPNTSGWEHGYAAGKKSLLGELEWSRAEIERLRTEGEEDDRQIQNLLTENERLRLQNALFAKAIVEGDEAFDGEAWEALLREAARINDPEWDALLREAERISSTPDGQSGS